MYVENTIGPPELGNAQKIKLAKAFVTHSNAKYVVAKIDENFSKKEGIVLGDW